MLHPYPSSVVRPLPSYWEARAVKELIKQYLDNGISRRKLISGLTTIGMSTVAAKAMAQNLAPAAAPAAGAVAQGAVREMQGTGGALFVAQLKAAGVKYIFFNPSTGDAPIFDALVDEPGIQLIKGVQEGAVVAMADGYARASGKPGVVVVADIGLPNAMTQMVNSWKDHIPLIVAVASVGQDALGRELTQATDHGEVMTQPITKWYWTAQSTTTIPETVRHAVKFSTTPPCGPVFLALPTNTLQGEAKAGIINQSKFDVPMRIRPDKEDIESAAKMLLAAQNPLVTIGDELYWSGAQKEIVELAELLGLPVSGQAGTLGFWSKPFPTRHPLFVGTLLPNMRLLGKTDLLLNLGNRFGERASPGSKLISIRLDPSSLARTDPVDLGMVADLKLAIQDLVAAVRSMATEKRLKEIAEERTNRIRKVTAEMREVRQKTARVGADSSPITLGRLGLELEDALDRDTCYVNDVDSGKTMDAVLSYGGTDKHYFGTGPNVLGWGMAGAVGVKLARPDQPVVSVVGDGSFLFSGPQPLWSMARYKVPVTVIVLNNRSYNNERNRIWNSGGRQFKTGRDMTCYLGTPDVDYAKTASAFGVEGETVTEPAQIRPALDRAKRATIEGRPYLLDVLTRRDGIGAASTYHPTYSVADQRTRKV
jgi:thiamine pyrophosphate-dependent acetolactate synthase large subunit-like protein